MNCGTEGLTGISGAVDLFWHDLRGVNGGSFFRDSILQKIKLHQAKVFIPFLGWKVRNRNTFRMTIPGIPLTIEEDFSPSGLSAVPFPTNSAGREQAGDCAKTLRQLRVHSNSNEIPLASPDLCLRVDEFVCLCRNHIAG
jgi:hypothetical protein